MERVVPLPRWCALIVILEDPAQPLDVGFDNSVREMNVSGGKNVYVSATHDLRNSLSLSSAPNFWR